MPDFTRILIHIISCQDCQLNARLAKALDSYKYWQDGEDEFSITTLNTFRNMISEQVTSIHAFDLEISSL